MDKKKILGIEVSNELYEEYYKMERRARYLEEDIKIGKQVVNKKTGKLEFKDSKEDSIERLLETGEEYAADNPTPEDILIDKETMLLLQEALKILSEEDQLLITQSVINGKTDRVCASIFVISHQAVGKRKRKTLEKLRNYIVLKNYSK